MWKHFLHLLLSFCLCTRVSSSYLPAQLPAIFSRSNCQSTGLLVLCEHVFFKSDCNLLHSRSLPLYLYAFPQNLLDFNEFCFRSQMYLIGISSWRENQRVREHQIVPSPPPPKWKLFKFFDFPTDQNERVGEGKKKGSSKGGKRGETEQNNYGVREWSGKDKRIKTNRLWGEERGGKDSWVKRRTKKGRADHWHGWKIKTDCCFSGFQDQWIEQSCSNIKFIGKFYCNTHSSIQLSIRPFVRPSVRPSFHPSIQGADFFQAQ